MAGFRELDYAETQENLAWLASRSGKRGPHRSRYKSQDGWKFEWYGSPQAADATGWDDARWVLHAIYEEPARASGRDRPGRSRSARGEWYRRFTRSASRPASQQQELTRFEDPNPGPSSSRIVRPITWGMSGPISADVARLTWTDLAARLSIQLANHRYPPGEMWFPDYRRTWPPHLYPPDEGSLDYRSFARLTEIITRFSTDGASTDCTVYDAPRDDWMAQGPLGEIGTLVGDDKRMRYSPSNWWPSNQGWMVYTDLDMWATKVSGTSALIAALDDDDWLETFAVLPHQYD